MDALTRHNPGLSSGRLSEQEYEINFSDSEPLLTRAQALIEAERCYYCYDAPCITACPTGINIPSFIHRIAQNNIQGAAEAILTANPLGGMCARVCPTEELCEEVCVRNTYSEEPVLIGMLQRYATDNWLANPDKPIFTRAPETGKKIAVVGSGPASLACAHGLAVNGHNVVIFEAKPKLGGLNEYGLASYKTTNNFAQREIDWLLSIGGIEVKNNQTMGTDFQLADINNQFDAVFLGLGMAGVNNLGINEESINGLEDAVDFIARLRQTSDLSSIPIGRKVVVIGGGMTAVDAAVQAKKLGAEEVSMVYRRDKSALSASWVEQRWAQQNGVFIRYWSSPIEVLHTNGHVSGVRFVRTNNNNGVLETGTEEFVLEADMVLKAIGQNFVTQPVGTAITLESGRIQVDDQFRTSMSGVWAGGDCVAVGKDLTVEAVEHGKRAAASIHTELSK